METTKRKHSNVVRTQQEIKERFEKANDVFGTQRGDLLGYMEFDFAKPFLKEDYVSEVQAGKEEWEVDTDPKYEILNYLEFAYGKALGERGLSAARSMLHFKTWIWLESKEFYSDIIDDMEDYDNYGIGVLDKISKHYGYDYEADTNNH